MAQSYLGVPIMAGDRALGVVALARYPRNGFSAADERLLTTIASNLGVALENARLYDETKSLLAQTDARAGELAIINEIGSALAKQLDFQAIIELVGERVGVILNAPDVSIGLFDPATNKIHFLYEVEDGERYHTEPFEMGVGLTSRIINSRQPLRGGSWDEMMGLGGVVVGNTDGALKQSFLGVPIPAGDRVLGAVTVVREAPNAFDDADERLLSTLASSMGVALENARLFDETKRLLSQTEERNTELAILSDVGQGLVQQLDLVGMVSLSVSACTGCFRG